MRPYESQEARLRLFIAVAVPPPVKAALERRASQLRGAVPATGIRWVRPDQIHLTLLFLGSVITARVDEVIDALRRACHGARPLDLEARGLGFFPDAGRPRVLWVGLRGETDRLHVLQAAVQTEASQYAERLENRPFSAHLTLARLQAVRPAEARRLAGEVAASGTESWGSWTADAVEVIRSELHPAGSRYTCLDRVPLRALPSTLADQRPSSSGNSLPEPD